MRKIANVYLNQKSSKEEIDGFAEGELGITTPSDRLPEELQGKLFGYLNYLTKQTESEEGRVKAFTVFKGMAEKKRTIKQALGKDHVTWQDMIPEGYTTWQAREGNVFFMANSIPERIAEILQTGLLEEVGITEDMITQVLTMGQKLPEMVVPEEVALTLNELHKITDEGPAAKMYHGAIRGWKQWQLLFIKRYFKYNARNLTGDIDAVIAGNMGTLKKVPQAWKELKAAFFSKDHTYSPELYEWFTRGGFETLLQAQEISDINRNRQFAHLMESKTKRTPLESIANLPKDAWLKWWDFARTTTDFREALLRYACYLDYLDQVQSNQNGRPKNLGPVTGTRPWG